MEFNDNNLNEEVKETNDGYVSQFGEIESDSEDYTFETESTETETTPEEPKKKFFIFRYINPSIFIAICVFLVALLAFGVYYVFGSKTITGTWIYTTSTDSSTSTADEAETSEVYYVFDSADSSGNGEYHMYSSGAEQTGEYTISSEDDKKIINLGGSDLYYDVEGVKLFGNATLKLTMPASTDSTTGTTTEEQTVELKQGSDPDYENQSFDDYEVDDNLLDEWTFSTTYSYYGQDIEYSTTLNFMDNGILKISVANGFYSSDITYYYAYTVKKGELTLQQVTTSDKSTAKYTIKDGKLTFDDDSIFADQTFTRPGDESATETTTEETTTEATTEATTKTTAKTTTAETSTTKSK
jgi:hypothetical protein